MDGPQKSSTSLFDVYLRLRPAPAQANECFLDVDKDQSHITLKPPAGDYRKRAIEKFAFTKVFKDEASQLDLFNGTTILPLIQGVVGSEGKTGKDGLLATLGVTGSGKTHTILGSRSQRGLTQMTLDVLFSSINGNIAAPMAVTSQLAAVDVSEAQIIPALNFLDSIYGDGDSRATSRAQTPMLVSTTTNPHTPTSLHNASSMGLYKSLLGLRTGTSPMRTVNSTSNNPCNTIRPVTGFARITRSYAKFCNPSLKDVGNSLSYIPSTPSSKRQQQIPRPSALPQVPKVDDIRVPVDTGATYAIVVSMYEVYNDRIFDLLTGSAFANKVGVKDFRRRPLLFKSTEYSPDRKVVAGLRKIVCGSLEEALMVLETGLTERRVAGTGSNAVSSRSHGFFCIDVKKRSNSGMTSWNGNTLTIVDLAGSERARTAKTAGATLAEAGKINESLMYLGQCMQMQSDNSSILDSSSSASNNNNTPQITAPKPSLVPFRQCKLTELLFSNSFPHNTTLNPSAARHAAQKAIMIVTADPHGDFNATSQILRYSALAREVTVPRIPSVTSTILSGTTAATSGVPNPNSRPATATSQECTTCAAQAQELALLRFELEQETQRRQDAEASWAVAEARLGEVEEAVRAECWEGFEGVLDVERARWIASREEEAVRNEKHLDEKVAILTKGVVVHEDEDCAASALETRAGSGSGKSANELGLEVRVDELEWVNARMKEKIEALEREKGAMRSPSKKLKPLKTRKWGLEEDAEDLENVLP